MISTREVLKTDNISTITNGTFVYCKELNKGFMKQDLSGLDLTDFSFESVTGKIETLNLVECINLDLDSIIFSDGLIQESHKTNKYIEEMVSNMSRSINQADLDNFFNFQKTKSKYFNNKVYEDAIANLNVAPVAVDDEATTLMDTVLNDTVSLILNDTDANNDNLTAIAGTYSTTQNGEIILSEDGTYVYTPATGFIGVDTFVYTVTDGFLSDTGTLAITVEKNSTWSLPNENILENYDYYGGTGFLDFDFLENGNIIGSYNGNEGVIIYNTSTKPYVRVATAPMSNTRGGCLVGNSYYVGTTSGQIIELNASTLETVRTITTPTGGDISGIAFNGTDLMYHTRTEYVYILDGTTDTLKQTLTMAGGDTFYGMTFDGTNIIVPRNSSIIDIYDGVSGNLLRSLTAPINVYGVAFNKETGYLWACNHSPADICRFDRD